MTVLDTAAGRDSDLRADLGSAAQVLAKVTLVGAVSGALAVGVLGRLAMLLLAQLNPLATGVTSDDGFEIGQFTLSGSLQLAASGLQFGVIGVFFYLALRGLMVGPDWFRLLSISLGPAVVIGVVIVHTDGVDFNVLEPVWLAAVLFIGVPGAYCALLHVLAVRALRPDRRLPGPLLLLGLLPWIPLLPLTLVLLGGFFALRALRRGEAGRAFLARVWPGWALRGALAALFLFAVVDLVSDVTFLSL
jgi:hypothetical protein